MNQKNQIKLYVAVAVVFFVACVISLIVLWFFTGNSGNKNTSFNYTITKDYKERGYNVFASELKSLLFSNNSDYLYEKMDKTFLDSNSLTKDNFKNYLTANRLVGNEVNLIKYSYYEGDSYCTYRVTYTVKTATGAKTNVVNVLESKPYHYTITFDKTTIPTDKNSYVSSEVDGIKFEISLVQTAENFIKYKVKMTNLYNESVKFDFSTLSNVQLLLQDGSKVNQASVVISEDSEVELNKESYITNEFSFNINLEYQNKIKSVIFENVNINEQNKRIEIWI